jgi:thiamine pyrophosphokinase
MAGKFHQAEALLALAALGGRLDRALQSMGDDLPASCGD